MRLSPIKKACRCELFQPMAASSISLSLAIRILPGTSTRRQTTGLTSAELDPQTEDALAGRLRGVRSHAARLREHARPAQNSEGGAKIDEHGGAISG